MATTIHMGYLGSVKIGSTGYFMSGSSINPNQAVEAPDLVAGYEMRRGWVYGKVDVSGNVSGPLHENASSLWDDAFDRDTTNPDHLANTIDIEIAFYNGGGWKCGECVLNTLQISATAGEVVQFTADFVGKKKVEKLDASTAVDCARLMTWDRCTFSIGASSGGSGGGSGNTLDSNVKNLQSINFTLNNNVQKLYAIQGTLNTTNGLYPVDLPCGVREITGSISAYAESNIHDLNLGADNWDDYDASSAQNSVTFKVDGAGGGGGSSSIIDVTFKAVFHRPTGSAQTGASIYSINFTAVCEAT